MGLRETKVLGWLEECSTELNSVLKVFETNMIGNEDIGIERKSIIVKDLNEVLKIIDDAMFKIETTESPPIKKPKLIKNSIRCKKCGKVLESKSVHDFKICDCKKDFCFVDGGLQYQRIGGDIKYIENLSIWEGVNDNGV